MILANAGDAEVSRIGVGEVETRGRRGGVKRTVLRRSDAEAGKVDKAVEREDQALVGQRGVADGRSDAAEVLLEQFVERQILIRRVAPIHTAHLHVQALGRRLSQAVRERLEQHQAVAVALGLVTLTERLGAVAHGDGEGADIVRAALRGRHDEVGQREAEAPLAVRLLADDGHEHILAVRAGDTDRVALRDGRVKPDGRAAMRILGH